ncbi:hypothetical protein AB0K05_41200 [Nonomuraea sp. NPDC049486]|uniref:hypothetical protein n=1 Tax=Nonomuraea sp. NPDC049486 TaxID=3155773 RepID=UPI00343DE42D
MKHWIVPSALSLAVLVALHPATRKVITGIRETRTMSVRNGQQVPRGLARRTARS